MAIGDDIPIRSNSDPRVTASWWNVLRTAIIGVFGTGATTEAQFTLANSQATANVTGMVFDKTAYKGIVIRYSVRRRTASEGRRAMGYLYLTHEAETDAWSIARENTNFQGTDDGVTFTVTSAGQVQYATDSISGASYSGSVRWAVVESFSVET